MLTVPIRWNEGLGSWQINRTCVLWKLKHFRYMSYMLLYIININNKKNMLLTVRFQKFCIHTFGYTYGLFVNNPYTCHNNNTPIDDSNGQ